MINLLLFILALACFGLAAAWMAENPGNVTIYWLDWRIDTSMGFLVAGTIAAGVVIALLYLLLRAIIKGPGALSTRSQLTSHKKAIAELTYSVASLAASDTKNAQLHAKKAEKLLGKSPITLLLSAQVARQQGNDSQTRLLLEQLLDFKETEYLAARSLSESASKQKLLPRALTLAKRAQHVNPFDADAVRSVISLQLQLGEWDQAMRTILKHGRKTDMSRAVIKRLQGITHMLHAQAAIRGDNREAAAIYGKNALKTLPDFVPAQLLAADAYTMAGLKDKAVQLMKKSWRAGHHPHIAEKLKYLTAGEPKKYAKLLQDIAQHRGGATPLYQCTTCGHSQPAWDAFCPSCNGFDTLV
ncbi:MAG: heme biosynthesis HemY N-terminal domain-containing protein [Alphaproteobacteria bacterium]